MSDLRGSALVCSDDAALAAAVTEAGFVATVAPTCDEALPYVRHDTWTVVAIDLKTGRDTLGHIHALPGARRRELFVVYFDARFTTADRMQAWGESVDLVVNPADLPNLRRILGDGMRDRDEFYRRFNEIRREAGARLGAHA